MIFQIICIIFASFIGLIFLAALPYKFLFPIRYILYPLYIKGLKKKISEDNSSLAYPFLMFLSFNDKELRTVFIYEGVQSSKKRMAFLFEKKIEEQKTQLKIKKLITLVKNEVISEGVDNIPTEDLEFILHFAERNNDLFNLDFNLLNSRQNLKNKLIKQATSEWKTIQQAREQEKAYRNSYPKSNLDLYEHKWMDDIEEQHSIINPSKRKLN